jgi:hypothetical protein
MMVLMLMLVLMLRADAGAGSDWGLLARTQSPAITIPSHLML